MKTIKIILGLSIAVLGLIGCDKKQEPASSPEAPPEFVYTPKRDDNSPKQPITKDILALKALGLKPLEINSAALPPLPEPDDPSDNIGLDTTLERWEKMWQNENGGNDPDHLIIGGDEGWRVISEYIIWAYGRPKKIVIGNKTNWPGEQGRDHDAEVAWWKGKPYIPITLNCRDKDFIKRNYNTSDLVKIARFDSLTRLHGVSPGKLALHQSTPMPYDLRHMRIAYNGVDISPLFSIRYKDYKEVTRSGDYSKWYWRDVRISEVGMDVLDWIFDGYFHIYPLTKDYPKFTIIFILKDGTILSREVEHIIQ